MQTDSPSFMLSRRLARAACAAAMVTLASPGHADPALSYWNYAEVWGSVQTSYTSPYLGTISFSVNGPDVNQYWDPSNPNSMATASFNIAPSQAPGIDPVYDIVTSGGAYGFGYSGTAYVSGASLHAQLSTSQVDSASNPVPSTPASYVTANAEVYADQQMYIAASATHPAGTYGAILVGTTLDGPAPTSDNSSYAQLYTNSSFTDTAGVNYQSSFTVFTYSGNPSWTGTSTVYKKLLFQYGTVFDVSNELWLYSTGNGNVNFLNTGKISSIELPLGATLDTGASQAGLGSQSQLYGIVFNATTADDPNTNWDFGNNGGGFTPSVPVPEPSMGLLWLAGLAVVAWKLRRGRAG